MIALISFSEIYVLTFRSCRSEVLWVKIILKICRKFKGEYPFRSGCSPVNLLHIFRTSFTKDTSGWLFLNFGSNVLWMFTCHTEIILYLLEIIFRSSHSEVFLTKGVLKVCSIFTGECPCWSVISVKLQCNFIKIALRHRCSPVNLLHISRTSFPKNISEWLFLNLSLGVFSIGIV